MRDQILEPNQHQPQDPHAQELRRHGLLLHHEQLRRVQPDRQRQRRRQRRPAGRRLVLRGPGVRVRFLQHPLLGLRPHRGPGAVLRHRVLCVRNRDEWEVIVSVRPVHRRATCGIVGDRFKSKSRSGAADSGRNVLDLAVVDVGAYCRLLL